jgi:hypothetical protein
VSTRASAITFGDLCVAMDGAGVELRVRLERECHAIQLVDFPRCRSITVPVMHGFDAAVTALCCSLALAADVAGIVGEGPRLAREWPELVRLARATAGHAT